MRPLARDLQRAAAVVAALPDDIPDPALDKDGLTDYVTLCWAQQGIVEVVVSVEHDNRVFWWSYDEGRSHQFHDGDPLPDGLLLAIRSLKRYDERVIAESIRKEDTWGFWSHDWVTEGAA